MQSLFHKTCMHSSCMHVYSDITMPVCTEEILIQYRECYAFQLSKSLLTSVSHVPRVNMPDVKLLN